MGGGVGGVWGRQTCLFSGPVLSQRVEPLLQQHVLFCVYLYWDIGSLFIHTDKPFKMNEFCHSCQFCSVVTLKQAVYPRVLLRKWQKPVGGCILVLSNITIL